MKMKRVLLSILILGNIFLIAEPSVYGSRTHNYNSNNRVNRNRYKKVIKKLNKKVSYLKQQVINLREQMEGLKSVVISLQRRVNVLSRQKERDKFDATIDSAKVDELALKLRRLEREMRVLKRENQRMATEYEKKISECTTALKSTRFRERVRQKPKYEPEPKPVKVTKVEREREKVKGDKKSNQKTTSQNRQKEEKIVKKERVKPKKRALSPAEIFQKAKEEFNQKLYSKAKKRFKKLIKMGHKVAEGYFYLGEIAYNQGRYIDAIELYQKSAEKKADTPYMDKLLIHTAIALKKSGQTAQAKEFFKTVIEAYPSTTSASTAKRYLKSMR